MILLIDTNILLDVLLERPDYAAPSAAVWRLVETNYVNAIVSALSVPNVHYLLNKYVGRQAAEDGVRLVLKTFAVIDLNSRDLLSAITSGRPDFEDEVQSASAHRHAATHVVTRDRRGFSETGLIVLRPEDLIAIATPHS